MDAFALLLPLSEDSAAALLFRGGATGFRSAPPAATAEAPPVVFSSRSSLDNATGMTLKIQRK